MKKLLVLLLTVFALNSCEKDPEIIGIDAEKKMSKVDVCHYDAETNTWETISINENALKAHLKHGDKIGGKCGYTYVPGDGFETHLINLGYDTVMDDYVLTSNINTVEALSIPPYWELNYLGLGNLVGIEDFKALKSLSITSHAAPNPDLSKNTNLLYVSLRRLESGFIGDFTNNIKLKGLSVTQCGISNLDLTKNVNLEHIQFAIGGGIIEDYSNFPKLTNLTLYRAYAGDLDLTNNINLESIYVDLSGALSVDLKNGNNTKIHYLEIIHNSGLECVQVDDVHFANSHPNWTLGDAIFSEDCSGYWGAPVLAKSSQGKISIEPTEEEMNQRAEELSEAFKEKYMNTIAFKEAEKKNIELYGKRK